MADERRRYENLNQEHIELLVRVDQNVANLVKILDQHIVDDLTKFRAIDRKQEAHGTLLHMGLGGLIVLQIILPIIFKFFNL